MAHKRAERGNPRPYFVKARKRWVAPYRDGAGTKHTVSAKTLAAVLELKALRLAQAAVLNEPPKLGTYLQEWVSFRKTKTRPNTWHAYVWAISHVVDSLGSQPIDHLTADAIEGMEQIVSQTLSARSLLLVHTVLRHALKDAVNRGHLAKNPMDLIQAPKPSKEEMAYLTLEEAQTFLRDAERDRWYPFWAVVLGTGLRSGEARGLLWSDIDEGQRLIHVRRQAVRLRGELAPHALQELKSDDAQRSIPVEESVLAILRWHKTRQMAERLEMRGWRDQGLVFPNAHGGILSAGVALKRLQRELVRLGLPSRTVHELRHTFGTLEMSLVENPKDVQQLMGHSQLSVTMRYVHTSAASRRRATSRLSDLLMPVEKLTGTENMPPERAK